MCHSVGYVPAITDVSTAMARIGPAVQDYWRGRRRRAGGERKAHREALVCRPRPASREERSAVGGGDVSRAASGPCQTARLRPRSPNAFGARVGIARQQSTRAVHVAVQWPGTCGRRVTGAVARRCGGIALHLDDNARTAAARCHAPSLVSHRLTTHRERECDPLAWLRCDSRVPARAMPHLALGGTAGHASAWRSVLPATHHDDHFELRL